MTPLNMRSLFTAVEKNRKIWKTLHAVVKWNDIQKLACITSSIPITSITVFLTGLVFWKCHPL